MFVPPVRKEQRREGNGRQQAPKRHYQPGVWVRRRFHGATLRSRAKSGQMETALEFGWRARLATLPTLVPVRSALRSSQLAPTPAWFTTGSAGEPDRKGRA